MARGLFLSTGDMVKTAWGNIPSIYTLLIPVESFHLEYSWNFATLIKTSSRGDKTQSACVWFDKNVI